MKAFRFRLQRVLDWRRTQLGVAESRLKEHIARLRRIEQAQRNTRDARDTARRSAALAQVIDGRELETLAAHLAGLREGARRLEEQRLEQERQVLAEQRQVVEARRRLRLLQRLHQKRLGEWTAEFARETDSLATDSFLARWVSEARS
jgi:hypothetical protein